VAPPPVSAFAGLPISPLDALLAFFIVAAGGMLQASLGFGMGLMAAPFLVLIDPAFVPGPSLLAALVLTVLVAHRERHALDFHGLRYAVVGRIVGTIPAALLISYISPAGFETVFAVMVILAVILSAVGVTFEPTPGRAAVAGALSGFMSTLSSVGGPPMALLYQNAEGPRFRSTLAGFFSIGVVISLVALAAVGRFHLREVALAAVLIPGGLAGFWLSRFVSPWMDRRGVRPFVLGLSFLAAAGVLWRALR
jgi:uncharacterized protein